MEGIAKTTSLILEYLVGGILILSSTGFLVFSTSATVAPWVYSHLTDLQTVPGRDTLFVAFALAGAYGVGVISEFLGQIIFENKQDGIKRKRLRYYIEGNESLLEGDHILKDYVVLLREHKGKTEEEQKESEFILRINRHAPSTMGEMRFYVLMTSQWLYAEVDSQIGRLRLLRVLFLVEILLTLSIAAFFCSRGQSPVLGIPFVVFGLCGLTTFKAVHARYERYCRAIERSYKVLLITKRQEHPAPNPEWI